MRAVLAVLGRTSRLRILERDDVTVHAVVRTPILRIAMDLDVVVDAARGRIDLRAATPFALSERSSSRTWALELLGRVEAEIRASQ